MQDAPRGIHRRIPIVVTNSLQSRFWNRVERKSDAECWPWLGANRNGYGAIKHQNKVVSAHVVSFVIHGGTLDEGIIVTHTCDNRICCNPSHLAAGTPTSNVVEMHQRRAIPVAHGCECYNAELTEEIVREIRRIAKRNAWGSVRTARHLGLSRWAVQGVLTGKNWRHVV